MARLLGERLQARPQVPRAVDLMLQVLEHRLGVGHCRLSPVKRRLFGKGSGIPSVTVNATSGDRRVWNKGYLYLLS
jgi:hypothetical protein